MNRDLMSPIHLIDELARFVASFKEYFKENNGLYSNTIEAFIRSEFPSDDKGKQKDKPEPLAKKPKKPKKSNKLEANGIDIFIGILIGACFNTMMEGVDFRLRRANMMA